MGPRFPIFLAAALLVTPGAITWDFEKDTPGEPAKGFKAEVGTWEVAQDESLRANGGIATVVDADGVPRELVASPVPDPDSERPRATAGATIRARISGRRTCRCRSHS